VVRAEIERAHLPAGTVSGAVTTRDGKPVRQPVVVIERDGKPYAWVLGRDGRYRLKLPAGRYALYATALNTSRSATAPVEVRAGGTEVRNFGDLEGPGRIDFSVADARSGAPLDARIVISEGEKPLVGFLGRKTFFTELERKGRAQLPIAPGRYVFTVSSGGGFLSRDVEVPLTVGAGETRASPVAITPLYDPPSRGWYSADLHHHADRAEAVTPPEDLARSQLAAGLDVLFVSDHDSTANHAALSAIAAARGVPFIPGVELSPSWGHFNAYPLTLGAPLDVDTSTASVDAILAAARHGGATVVQVNHPFIPFGYFTSVRAGVAPGGFNPGFDVVEINSTASADDGKVLSRLWEFWNAGERHYLAAGSDTHDVWNAQSGQVRTFVHPDGAVTAASFAQALKSGHAYVSYGPLVFPATMFGTGLEVRPGEPFVLSFDLASVAGLSKAELIGGGAVKETRTFAGAPLDARVDFTLTAEHPGWYALGVEDSRARRAYTDPVWVNIRASR
jgi:hypothetical protein